MAPLPFSAVPGPGGPDMLRAIGTIRRDAVAFLDDCSRRYGPIVSFPIPRTPVVHVRDPDAVRRVLQTNHQAYGKRTVQYDALRLVTGDGLLTSDGAAWHAMRRLLQPAFHHDLLGGVVAGVDAAADRLVEGWSQLPAGAVVDVDEAMMRVTLEVVGSVLFGADLADEADHLVAAVAAALDVVVSRAQLPVQPPAWLPTPGNRRLAGSLRALDAAVQRLVLARRQRPDGNDVLGLLLAAQRDRSVSERQVRNEVVTLIVAGHETVAATLTWCLALLAGAPDQAARVRDEARALGPAGWSLESLAALPVTRAVVDESLRLQPPAWLVSRRALAPDVLGGYAVPEGTVVIVSPTLVHRDPQLWPDPDRFDPDRFLGERRRDADRRGYLPFGAGPRLCIGRDLALLETVLLLARVVAAFDVEPVRSGLPEVRRGVTARPVGGLPARVRPAAAPTT